MDVIAMVLERDEDVDDAEEAFELSGDAPVVETTGSSPLREALNQTSRPRRPANSLNIRCPPVRPGRIRARRR